MNQSLAYIIDIEIDRLQKVPSVVISQSLNSDREKKINISLEKIHKIVLFFLQFLQI